MSSFKTVNPTDPNRLKAGVTAVADKDKLPLLKQDSPLKRNLKIGALILSLLSGGVIAAGAAGVPLPAPLVTVAKVIGEIAKLATEPAPEQPAGPAE